MANVQINDLAAKATPIATDELEIQETGGGTSKKTTAGNLTKALTAATISVQGAMSSADKTKLDAIEASATADQTGPEIKALYEVEASAFTDAQFTKLAGIEALADVTDAANVAAAGALLAATYDPAAIAEQLVGLVATQSLTNKTLNDDSNTIHADAVHKKVRNVSGSSLVAGTPVYVTGYNAGQDRGTVDAADANDSAKMPAIGIVDGEIANNANGHVISMGVMNSLDTSSYSEGDTLYVSNVVGALTNVKPTATTDQIQKIAIVVRSHSTLGRILVQHAGRVNGIPNELIPPVNNAHDLGTAALSWKDLYLDGDVVVGGTVDGRDVAADGTKLDGVEALADVTDETNVTSALPVSDATSLVKDPADGTKRVRVDVGAIATGTTRAVTIPDQNVDLTPNTGTFSAAAHASRHIDGSDDIQDATAAQKGLMTLAYAGKLDGIEALATADQTAGEIEAIVDHDNLLGFASNEHFTQAGITTVGTVTVGNVDAVVTAASLTAKGKVELATVTETSTGTDAARGVTPDGLAGSKFGEKAIQLVVFDFASTLSVGDGKFYFHVDSRLGGMNLVDVHAEVITAGTTGTTDIQINNVTQAADMLSTKLTIDSTETGSDTAATPAVIDTANDDVAENDLLRVDIDAISTTAPKGLILTLGFRLP